MARTIVTLLSLAALGLLAAPAWAENEGQADLDKATELKLEAENDLVKLGKVILLCESSLQKGLDEGNTEFAKQLLASTRLQRGMLVARATMQAIARRQPQWEEFRKFAIEELSGAVEAGALDPQALMLIAQLQLLPGGDRDKARQAVDKAVEAAADDAVLQSKALIVRAGLSEDPEKRIADLNEAVRIVPNSAEAIRARGLIYADQQKYDEAIADFDKLIELAPEDLTAYVAKAEVFLRQKKFDEALAAAEKAQELAPRQAEPLVLKGQIHGLQSKYEEAVKDLDQAIQLDPTNVAAMLLRASVYQELKQPEKALGDVDQVLKLRPGLPMAMRLRTAVLAGSGRFDEAVKQLEQLQQTSPGDPQVMLDLALVYSGDDKPYEAIELFTKVLAKDPNNVTALRGRADTLLNVGKHREAIGDYEKMLAQSPDDEGALNNLAWVLATSPDEKVRDGKRSIELATKACEVTEYKEAHILSTLAAGYAETGDFETAIKWSAKAVELGSDDQKEPLTKELESYRAGKPWRELLTGPKSDEPKADEAESDEPDAPALPTLPQSR
jgi:tetratricopeptide (TPR) repeat protein